MLSMIVDVSSVILVGCKIEGKNPAEDIEFRNSEELLFVSYFSRSMLKSPEI